MRSIFKYFSESREEFNKFTFPKRSEASRTTWAVLIIIFLVSFYLFFVDFIFSRIVKLFLPYE
ncbi:MAG: preprotein translocase subunit SecE [Deltaproteobacteria bacterium]|nr:preprotein translocase subunit SecE [Deltaproteobacteria bacterium]